MFDNFIGETFLEESDVLFFLQEAVSDKNNTHLRTAIIDPIISVMETKSGRDQYLKYGTEFIESNADMLAREFPTKRVSFPQKYVDNILNTFGFTKASLHDTLKELCLEVKESSEFKTIVETPTNVIHAVVLMYSDMVYNRNIRDSARQQLALSVYNVIFNKFYHTLPDEKVMAYTYMHLNRNWDLLKAENMVTWIADIVDSSYAFYKSKMSLNMSMKTLIMFLNRLRAQMRQKVHSLSDLYFKNQTDKNRINDDSQAGEDYIISDDNTKVRDNLMRLIKNGDRLYGTESELYTSVGKLKNVSSKSLYELSKKVSHHDIVELIDLIFYVFISKEHHKIEEINSTVYIGEITNLPTKVDRCIPGKPIIAPYVKKYGVKKELIIGYICLIATWIMLRINDVSI